MPVHDPSLGGTAGSPMVSVVVPSYQSKRHIADALQALLAQKTGFAYEIIVVDSSTDGTEQLVQEQFPQVRLLHFAYRCQVGTARNLGVQASSGGIVLFVDADTIPQATWLDQMCRAMVELGADGAGGSMSNGTPWSITGSAGFYLEFFRYLEYNGEPYPTRYLVGGNSGFRKELLTGQKYLDQPMGEDLIFSSRLASEGRKLLFLPRAAVRHQNKTGLRTVLGYQQRLGEGAYRYRSQESAGSLRLLRAFPPAVFLMPVAVMFWIGGTLLRRRRFADFLRFIGALPLCLTANCAWALGFYRALRKSTGGAAASEPGVPAASRNRGE